jgi:hypothetical protein
MTQHITDGYFSLLGIRLVGGRGFDVRDRFSEPQLNWTTPSERGVVVVSEATARALWPGQPAIGQALWLPDGDNVLWREVVGIVEDIQVRDVGEVPALQVFVPWTQETTGRPRLLVKATTGPATAMVDTVRAVVQGVEPGTLIDRVVALEDLVSIATAEPRFTSRMVVAFGVLALGLAAVGIYGTLSYLVGTRTREIGIRLALGATPMDMLSDVLTRGLAPALVGSLIGLAAAIGLGHAFRSLLFGVEPVDPVSLVTGGVTLLAVALAAALGPAWRAARVDPVRVLGTE